MKNLFKNVRGPGNFPATALIGMFITIVFFFSCINLFAQAPAPMFQLVKLPRKVVNDKATLNTELSKLTNKEEVKKLLREKKLPPETTIVIQITTVRKTSWWTINTSTGAETEDDNIILQSRGISTTKFSQLSDFRNFFQETVAILDTLKIQLSVKDNDYPGDRYIFSFLCGDSTREKKIPLIDGNLIFSKGLIGNCEKQPVPSLIFNKNKPNQALAECDLVFLTDDQRETLLQLANFIKANEKDKSEKEIALSVATYASNRFGTIYFPHLVAWLDKNTL